MTPELAARTYALPAADPVRAKLESPFFGRLLPRLVREAGGGRVLDLGCGDCQAASLAGSGLEGYVGVDLRSPDAECDEEVVVHDLRAGLGPVGPEPFDLYLATFGVASHLDPGELAQLLSEVADHAGSGSLVAFEALGLYSLEWPQLWSTPPGRERLLDYRLGADVSVHPWGPDELGHLFEDAGLQPLRALDRSLQTGPKLGDGRYFVLFWMFVWTMSFVFAGGKFTRYFTVVLPAVLITAAIGVQYAARWIGDRLEALLSSEQASVYARTALPLLLVLGSVWASAGATPHFRLYTNALGGGMEKAGSYFPHDEFYDSSMREVMTEISKLAKPNARVATETPGLAAYYAQRANRADLVLISLSDQEALRQLSVGDFVVVARGRRYFSNDALISALQGSSPATRVTLGTVPSADIYKIDSPQMLNPNLNN